MHLLPPATFGAPAALTRLAQALGRMWMSGALGEEGGSHLGVLSQFALLDDKELGPSPLDVQQLICHINGLRGHCYLCSKVHEALLS